MRILNAMALVLVAYSHAKSRSPVRKPVQLTFGPVAETEPIVSPDGHWIAFQSFDIEKPSVPRIWIMDASNDYSSAKPLVDKREYSAEMSWSPDSKWIAFIGSDPGPGPVADQIYKVNVATKEVLRLSAFPPGTLIGDSTTWSGSGIIAFEKDGEILGIQQDGEQIRLADTRTALSKRRPSNIRFSPDGMKILFSVENESGNQSEIWVASVQHPSFQRLTSNNFDVFPAWISSDRIVFTRETLSGSAEVQILSLSNGALQRVTYGHTDFSPSADSLRGLMYFSRKGRVPKELSNASMLVGFHVWSVPIPTSGR
jgi:Tol biopolymer transport system component